MEGAEGYRAGVRGALMSSALLDGVRVLDLGIWRPVPYATQLLAEMGADVLKVEPPGGDPMRVFPELFAVLNAGKRSITIDLKTDTDRAKVIDLVADADAFMEGFRPGVADRLGVGYESVRAAIRQSSIARSRDTGRPARWRRCRDTTSTIRPTPAFSPREEGDLSRPPCPWVISVQGWPPR